MDLIEVLITFLYISIFNHIKVHSIFFIFHNVLKLLNSQRKRIIRSSQTLKQRRTNIILFSISLVFFLRCGEDNPDGVWHISRYCNPNIFSWLPFSLYCIITEVTELFDNTGEEDILTFLFHNSFITFQRRWWFPS